MAATPVKIIWGGGGLGYYPHEIGQQYLEILEKYDVKDIDTAFAYPNSEMRLGELGAAKKFTIHTKAPAFTPHCLGKDSILQAIDKQLELLGVDSVEIYYLHAPDVTTPIEETLEAINTAYKAGKFRHFGLSNFTPRAVQQVHDICARRAYPLPTIYQGNYNPVARTIEADLLPLLRSLHIAFYAYSPLAGGFLVKDVALFASASAGAGRWARDNPLGAMYRALYGKPAMVGALAEWGAIAAEAGVSRAALAYRWVRYHSALRGECGDGCVVGASRTAQLVETLRDLGDGPLPRGAVERIERVWETVRHEAPVDNYNSYLGRKEKI